MSTSVGTAVAVGFELLGSSDLGGFGDGMQVLVRGDVAYVGHLGNRGTSIVDISDPTRPRLRGHIPAPSGTHSHKVQIANDLLLVNREQLRGATAWTAGFDVYDLRDPFAPALLSEWRTVGTGVHRMWFTEDSPLAFMSASLAGFTDRILVIFDLSDPTGPREVGRWWLPGMNADAGEMPTWDASRRCTCHHAVVQGNRAYVGWWDLGAVILDVTDPGNPQLLAHLDWYEEGGGATHTLLPLGRWLVAADEALASWPEIPEKRIRLIDAADERHPRIHGLFPQPADAAERQIRGLRYGPHNLHENRPGTWQSATRLFATYYSGGVRAYDLHDDGTVVETAAVVPNPPPGQAACQSNDLVVRDDGLMLFTDRLNGGLSIARAV